MLYILSRHDKSASFTLVKLFSFISRTSIFGVSQKVLFSIPRIFFLPRNRHVNECNPFSMHTLTSSNRLFSICKIANLPNLEKASHSTDCTTFYANDRYLRLAKPINWHCFIDGIWLEFKYKFSKFSRFEKEWSSIWDMKLFSRFKEVNYFSMEKVWAARPVMALLFKSRCFNLTRGTNDFISMILILLNLMI